MNQENSINIISTLVSKGEEKVQEKKRQIIEEYKNELKIYISNWNEVENEIKKFLPDYLHCFFRITKPKFNDEIDFDHNKNYRYTKFVIETINLLKSWNEAINNEVIHGEINIPGFSIIRVKIMRKNNETGNIEEYYFHYETESSELSQFEQDGSLEMALFYAKTNLIDPFRFSPGPPDVPAD